MQRVARRKERVLDVSMHLDELVDLEPIMGSRRYRLAVDAQVHTAALSERGDRVLVHADGGELLARIVAHGATRPRGPVMVLPPEVSPVRAYAAIMQELLDRSQALANRTSAILSTLTQADLEGRDLQSIVTLLAKLVDNPVSLKDSHHRVMAWSGDPELLDRARQDTVERGAVPDAVLAMLDGDGVLDRIRTESRPFRVCGHDEVGFVPRIVCPVRSGEIHFGYLSISEGRRRLDAHDFTAVEYGATVVAFHLSRDRAVEESIRSQKALLIYELLFNPTKRSTTSRRQAALLQIDLSRTFAVLVVIVAPRTHEGWDDDRWTRAGSSMVATIDAVLARRGITSAVALAEEDDLLLITPVDGVALDELAAILVRELDAYHHATVLAVGISQPREGSDGLKDSYEEARLAADLGQARNGLGAITHYADLGALRLLSEIPGSALARHLSATLGDDPRFRDQFRTTYGALVECSYNKAAAARRLYIHVNTLKYRMARITQRTGHDPADHNGRFALECTLRLLDLQRSRDPAPEQAPRARRTRHR